MYRSAALGLNIAAKIASVAVLAFLVLFCIRYDSLAARTLIWGNLAECPIRLIKTRFVPKQILIIGTSRTMQGVSADRIAQTLHVPAGSFINLSHNGRYTDLQYLLVEELVARDRLERIVVEFSVSNHANDRLLTKGKNKKANFGTGASYIRSEGAAAFASSRQLKDAVRGLPLTTQLHEYLQKFAMRFSYLVKVVLRDIARSAGLRKASPTVQDTKEQFSCRLQTTPKPKLIKPAPELLDSSGDYFQRKAMEADREMYKKLVSLANKNNIDLVFLRVPERFSGPDAEDLGQKVQTELGAVLITPPDGLIARLRDGHYADESHFDTEGARIFSDWLASTLRNRVQGQSQ